MPLLTVRAAAAQLGVAYSTLKRWVHTGVVRTTRTEGGHHRISDAEIDRLLARSAFAEASADKPGGAKASARKQPPTRSARSGQARSTRSARSGQAAGVEESVGGLSARNRLHGFVDEVRVDGLLAQVRLRVGSESL